MDDKQFKKWLKEEKKKKKKTPKIKYKIITRRKGIWNIPENF